MAATAPRPAPSSTALRVVCDAAGVTLDVPADTPVLEAVRQAGLAVTPPCPDASCGACETRVLEGEPDHRDQVLSDDERAFGDTVMICVSRARSAQLVLDL